MSQFLLKQLHNLYINRGLHSVQKTHQRVSLSCRELFLFSPFLDLCWRVFLLFISFFCPFGIKSVLKTIVTFRFNVPSELRMVLKHSPFGIKSIFKIIVPFWNNNVPSKLWMILTVYKYSFNILIEEKLKSGNGGITIFEWS